MYDKSTQQLREIAEQAVRRLEKHQLNIKEAHRVLEIADKIIQLTPLSLEKVQVSWSKQN